ncbi:MAG: YaaA family protein [Bacteroidales bacterium]
MLLLISPSRVMNMTPSKIDLPADKPLFQSEAELLANEMRGLELQDMAKFMEEDDHMARETLDLYRKFRTASSKQALFAYDGKVYKAMDPASFTPLQLDFAAQHLRIISTLYGYLRPFDVIKEYRLNFYMHYNEGNLYDFWRPRLSPVLNKDAMERGDVILNFTALDVMKAVDLKEIRPEVSIIHVEFKDYKADKNEYISIRAYAQPAKGKLIGYIIRHTIDNPEELKSFETDGYTYNQLLSNESEMVFTRKR